jgi:hypothetical protein
MTAFSQSITNRLLVSGGGVTENWGVMLWGQFWAEGDLGFSVKAISHQFSSPCVLGEANHKSVLHLLENSQATDSAPHKDLAISFANTQGLSDDPSDIRLLDGSGYTYVFPSNALDFLDSDRPIYTSGAVAVSPWATATAGSATWSPA